ncbi:MULTISPECIES: HAMP domain-containing sensor histidine kinase [unclassified Sphingomonas]|uniref:sensor histidine kinase n=1 Tax=unclassified Sphingomonas TaxID=196159 RepID=UPI001E61FA85|nr:MULTISPECIES: HAMP domain-containing sensor histidine kinase [unclassified Sphingomonas]
MKVLGRGSLRTLTAAFLAMFLATVLATGVASYSASRAAVERLIDRRVATVSDELDDGLRRGDVATLLARIDRLTRTRDTGDIGLELKDADGRRLGGNIVLGRILPPGFSTLHHGDGIAGLSAGRALVRDLGGGLWLTVVAETEPVDDYARVRLRNAILGFGAIVLVVLGGTILFAVLIERRIARVRATAEAIIDGDMRARVPVDPTDGAFAAQAMAFNRMLDRIAALMEGIAGVSHDIAHDLRMPLARLRSRLTLIAARASDPALQAELEGALAQCDDLLGMFAATLRITEIEGGDRRAAFAPIDLAALARDVGEAMAPVAEESGHRLGVEVAAPSIVDGDRRLLTQALVNLVENALRYTPAGTRVTIVAGGGGDTATIGVCDAGPGIAAADRPLALRRFGRLDASRTTDGHGLGLPLVDAIARLHRGALVLDDADPGLSAMLTLPAGTRP